ncbi:uncharacterized protein TNCV_1873571 [Trichonephila clavipes]|nr:uncharacterized protein TNCV_1873571 [Trichonephila clavipes]
MPVLRETGALLDIGFEKCAAPEMFKGENTDNGNLVKLSACEIIEAQLRSEESAYLIWGTENGASDEASDQEGASMQLIPVRHKVSTELYIDAIGPLPIVPIRDKYILPDMCMSPRCHEAVPVLENSSTPLWRRCYRFLEEGSFLKRFKQMKEPYS